MALRRWPAAVAAAGALAFASPGSLSSQTGPPVTSPTSAIVFGVGSPNLAAERSGTSIGIVAGGSLYIFDAGPGVERRIMEARSKLATLQVRMLGPIFITHLHRDHTAGLAALLAYHDYGPGGLTLSPGADRHPLTIYGPAPAKGAAPDSQLPDWNRSITDTMNHLRAPGRPRRAPGAPDFQPGRPRRAPGAPDFKPGRPRRAPGASDFQPGRPHRAPGRPRRVRRTPRRVRGSTPFRQGKTASRQRNNYRGPVPRPRPGGGAKVTSTAPW